MKRSHRIIAVLLAGMVFGLGLVTLVQYATGHAMASAWTGHAAMASPTALAFVFIGVALVLLVIGIK